ncbi:hypothetical protein KR026_004864 [Drosophila bipectinata]|nr:hypothetical protein KR026_004864 [Drosophila bipectinata]
MWKVLCFGLLCLAVVQAAVIRPETTEATATTTPIPEDEESTTTVASNTSALSRDEEATILIDPAPGTLHEDETPVQEKSGKLLLLSTPPKRPVEIERQLEEDEEDEQDSPADAEPTTTVPSNTVEEEEEEKKQEQPEETTVTTESSTTPATTKLFAVDARPAKEDSPPPNVAVSLSQDNVTVSISEQPQVPGDNNAAVELAFVEPEAEYVLVDSSHDGFDIELDPDLQLGSFTHIDSDVHLQPAVHSVEIVPTSFDDPLIVNYVHNLR